VVFDAETFVSECQRAASAADTLAAVQEIVAPAIGDPASIDATLGSEFKGESDTLFSSPDLTVQRIQWPRESPAQRMNTGGLTSSSHR
jgi:hypothetical protein